jgi:hypothetical protein
VNIWRLHIGKRFTGITVIPDEKWPGMWRVQTPDGRVSDMVNLTRAKDAGLAAVTRANGRGLRQGGVASWHIGESPGAASLAASIEGVAA